MSASSYKPLSRKMLCPACGSEQVFKNSVDDPTRWKCQGPGCSVSCTRDARGVEEPIFEGVPGPDYPYEIYEDAGEEEIELIDALAVVEAEQTAPARINLAPVLDLSVPLADRTQALMGLLKYAARAMVDRDAEESPDAYENDDFYRQQIARLTLKGITDLGQASHKLELQWAMEHTEEVWVDADGAEVTLQEVIEGQMPDEEQRKSSGRARQVWAFGENAVPAFRKAGISDRRIAECNNSGLSSVLSIVSSAQHKLEETADPGELRDKYERLIDAASETTTLQGLKKAIKTILDPSYEPPPSIHYSVENDGEEHWWFVARPTHEQFTEIMLGKMGDVLELDKQLPEWFYRYWDSFINVPAGQGDE